MLLRCQLLIGNQIECKVSFLIERGMFPIKACILNDQMRKGGGGGLPRLVKASILNDQIQGALPYLANLFSQKINFHCVSLKRYLILYAKRD